MASNPTWEQHQLKVVVSGASGFVGRAVVEELLEAGHNVVALVREKESLSERPGLEVVGVDLRHSPLTNSMDGCHALVHLAAVMKESPGQIEETLRLTDRLLAACDRVGIEKVLLMSSIAVYDYTSLRPYAVLNEDCPINFLEYEVDSYGLMKSKQESLCRQWYQDDRTLVTFRPGLIYSDRILEPYLLGLRFVGARRGGEIPVIHRKSVAEAVVASLQLAPGQYAFNLLNRQLPTYDEYLEQILEKAQVGRMVFVPGWLYRIALRTLGFFLARFGLHPGGLKKNTIESRCKPLCYSSRAPEALTWNPFCGLDKGGVCDPDQSVL